MKTKTKYIIILIFIIISLISLFGIFLIENEKEDNNLYIYNISAEEYYNYYYTTKIGITIENITEIKTPEEKRAFLYGYFKHKSLDNVVTNILILDKDNNIVIKTYQNLSDFPYGDDCLDDEHCFIKWEN